VAFYSVGAGKTFFMHPNLVGSTTQNTNQSGASSYEELYYPWGQSWTSAGGTAYEQHFASLYQGIDTTVVQDRADYREYKPFQGRWLTPDPAGLGAVEITNPQSFNRYAYVLNNPLSLVDPLGLCGGSDTSYIDDNGVVQVVGDSPCPIGIFIASGGNPINCYGCGNVPGGGSGGSGSGQGSGTGTGTSAPPPSNPTQTVPERLACAATFGSNHSIAAAFGAQNNFLANLFLGNTASSLTNLGLFVFGGATPSAANFASMALKGAAQGIPVPPGNPGLSGATGQLRSIGVQAAVGAGYNAITGAGAEPIELGLGAAGTVATPVAQLGSETLSNVAFGVGVAKFGFDASTFLYGYFVSCPK
jgi:RHS repeat-associated protein